MSNCLACGFEPASSTGLDPETCPSCGAARRDPLLGALLGDRYQIIERIGVGGMGAVYRALHTTLKRQVAVKVLLPDFGGKEEFARRFEREAESASRLAHPNIIAITDFGRTPEGLLFLVMEFLDGQLLTALVKQGPIDLRRALHITRQMLSGLGHAHAAGVVHRDLKPDNIMLVTRHGRSDVVKILDFGIAKVTDTGPAASAATHEALTQAGMIFGTPEYLSPEQALGDVVDARADLYATGVILFEMLTGRRPFESADKVRIISMHLSHAAPRPSQVNPAAGIPTSVEDVVMQALEKEREHRFGSATAFLGALAEAEAEVEAENEESLRSPARASAATIADKFATPPPLRQVAPSADLTGDIDSPPRFFDHIADGGRSDGNYGWRALPRRLSPRVWIFVGTASVLLVAAFFGLFSGGTGGPRPGAVATGRITRPARPSQELAARIRVIEGLLAAGEIVKARVALEQVLAENPSNGRVRYLLARLAFAEERHAEALDDYRQAVALDPGFRADPILIDHIDAALGEPRTADAALDLAIEGVGRPAVPLLERVANGNGDLRRRQRAARALEELGEQRRVDTVALRSAELKKAVTCEEKKPLVVALGNAEDARALPALRAQRSRGGIEGLFRATPDNRCMKAELAEAIAKLEAKFPSEKRSSDRSAARKSSARTSIFRGR